MEVVILSAVRKADEVEGAILRPFDSAALQAACSG